MSHFCLCRRIALRDTEHEKMHALHENPSHRPTSFFIDDILLSKPKSAASALAAQGRAAATPSRGPDSDAVVIPSVAGSLFTRPGAGGIALAASSGSGEANASASAAHVAAIAAASLQAAAGGGGVPGGQCPLPPRVSLGPPVGAHLPAEYAASLAAYLPGPAAAAAYLQQHPFSHPAFAPKPDHPFLLPATGERTILCISVTEIKKFFACILRSRAFSKNPISCVKKCCCKQFVVFC